MDVFPEPDPRRLGEGGQVVKVMESVTESGVTRSLLPFDGFEVFAFLETRVYGSLSEGDVRNSWGRSWEFTTRR